MKPEDLTDTQLEAAVIEALCPAGAPVKFGEVVDYVATQFGVSDNAIYGVLGSITQRLKRQGKIELVKGPGGGWRICDAVNARNAPRVTDESRAGVVADVESLRHAHTRARQFDVLRNLDDVLWLRPMDIGGHDASHHSATLAQCVRHGWAERTTRGSDRSYTYRRTPLGHEAVRREEDEKRRRAKHESAAGPVASGIRATHATNPTTALRSRANAPHAGQVTKPALPLDPEQRPVGTPDPRGGSRGSR